METRKRIRLLYDKYANINDKKEKLIQIAKANSTSLNKMLDEYVANED